MAFLTPASAYPHRHAILLPVGLLPKGFVANPLVTIAQATFETAPVFVRVLPGLRIATPSVEVLVEDLSAGGLVLTAAGRALPVLRVGRQEVATACAGHDAALPVEIAPAAQAEGAPSRPLRVAPDHALLLLLDGVLMQIGALVIGTNIRRLAARALPAVFPEFHVETADLVALLAEGAGAESYLANVPDARMAWQGAELAIPADKTDALRAMSARRSRAGCCSRSPRGQQWRRSPSRRPTTRTPCAPPPAAGRSATMNEPLPPLLLVGCGKMGSAMVAGWREQGAGQIVAVEPNADAAARTPGILAVPEAAAIPEGFRPAAVILAIKPQEAEAALPAYARFAADGALVVSIMAGRSISFLRRLLGPGAAVVRAMPNTPAAVRQGFTAAYAAPGVDDAARALADRLLSAIGEVAWVEREDMLDAVTAVSGGGPAYVFLLAEMLEMAALDQGLPPDLARRMARATVAGSGALLGASAEDAATLRRAVTSPKGTTERALAVLMADDAWPALMKQAIAAATARSRELAG